MADAMVLIVMGPMGCGKTTVGSLLAGRLGWRFIEGDDFHPSANVENMRKGIPLTDRERIPWLEALASEIAACRKRGESAVLACSALKADYRKRLGVDQKTVVTVYLKGDHHRLLERIEARAHPYMNAGLLKSQLDTLEPPMDGIVVDIAGPPETIVERVVDQLRTLGDPS
jgi:carbohydrate kinase (thermoresistant glucokinase family)